MVEQFIPAWILASKVGVSLEYTFQIQEDSSQLVIYSRLQNVRKIKQRTQVDVTKEGGGGLRFCDECVAYSGKGGLQIGENYTHKSPR